MSIQGKSITSKWIDDSAMGFGRNAILARSLVQEPCLCAVIRNGDVVHFEERQSVQAGEYSRQAYAKFGKCRVLFYIPSEAGKVWREIRWKNANVGTLYRRPSFSTMKEEHVPPQLAVALLCL